jgi:hypothetical protein
MRGTKSAGYLFRAMGVGAILAGGLAYYRVSQINRTMGNDILEYSLRTMRAELDADNQLFNDDNKLHFLLESISNELDLIRFRVEIYLRRLLHAGEYELTCREVAQTVIAPLLASYESERVFEYSEIVNDLREEHEFNNKLALQLTRIQQRNAGIKAQHRLLLQRFYELQEELLTAHVYGLTEESEQRINLLYDYFREREQFLAKMLSNSALAEPSASPAGEERLNEEGLGFKLQFL